MLQTYVKSILYYGSESWTINSDMHSQLEMTEMRFLRRTLKVHWITRISNKCVLIFISSLGAQFLQQ